MHRTGNNLGLPVVILCGGKGTRLGWVSTSLPKPLLTVGNKPILWHVMKIYASWGHKRFILCLGHNGAKIRDYFKNNNRERWHITCVDTGSHALKSRRIMAVKHLIKEDNFFLAYGDDVADINFDKLLKFHLKAGRIVTISAVRILSDFGVVEIAKSGKVLRFKEKPYLDKWMNGGFMVMNRKIFDYLDRGELEDVVFKELARKEQISAYRHRGSWKTMNTLKDNLELNSLWNKSKAFWKKW